MNLMEDLFYTDLRNKKTIVQLVYSEFILLEMHLTKSAHKSTKFPALHLWARAGNFAIAILPLQLVLCYTMSREVWGIVQSRSLSFAFIIPLFIE